MSRDPEPRRAAPVPLADLLRLAYGAQSAQLLYAAAKLGLADLLQDGRLATADLAAAAGVDAALLRRVLRGVVSLGVLAEAAGDRFALTEMGQYLRSDRPDSVQPRVIFNTELLQPGWAELLHTGEPGFPRAFGMPLYDYLTAHPAIGALFDRTMASEARYRFGPAVAAYDFSRFDTIIDVGGGSGALLIEILRAYERPRGIIVDLPPVAERARQHIAAAGLAHRCAAVGGDASEAVPQGADAYLLSNFLVSMDDERAAGILRRCRAAMAGGGRVLLVEWVMPAGGETADPYRFWDTTARDLIMVSGYGAAGGRVRTAEEFRALVEAGGLTLAGIIPTASPVSVIEALDADVRSG